MTSEMDDSIFLDFKNEVESAVTRRGFAVSDIDFINFDSSYSITPQVFFEIISFPSVVATKFFRVNWCSKWDVPYDFRVVMKNGTILLYNQTSDEYYSGWICVSPVKKSPIEVTK
jgi:hypothetical protein